MSESPESPRYSWSCRGCGRKVPHRFETCRCGAARAEVEVLPEGALDAETASTTPRSGPLSWIVLAVIAVIACGTLVALQVTPASAPLHSPELRRARPADPARDSPDLRQDNPSASMPSDTAADRDQFALVAPAAPVAHVPPIAPAAPDAPGFALEDVVSRSIPAIVSIETGDGRGSGFFAAPRTVVTNRHVIQNNVSVMVKLSTGQRVPGRVDTSSQEYDLAIVRVDGAPASHAMLPLGTVEAVRPGQEVIAIGLALGVFQNSVTRGIISAVRRADRTVMLQTDAAINPGNSGGPLINRRGEVVGINTLKVGGAAESLGFAVAVDHARALLSGNRQPSTPAPAASSSRTLAPAFGARSDTDLAREQGTRRYQQVVEATARQATRLDSYWDRIKANCTLRIAAGYDREWFGLWDGRTALTAPDPSCGSAVDDLQELSAEIRTVMSAAQEEARRAAVLPGQLRDVRRRYRMDWVGFDR